MQCLKTVLQFNIYEGSVVELILFTPADGGGTKINPIILFF